MYRKKTLKLNLCEEELEQNYRFQLVFHPPSLWQPNKDTKKQSKNKFIQNITSTYTKYYFM